MANASILAAFERMWQHVASALSKKSDINHNHDDLYYTESEINSKVSDINTAIENLVSHTENTENPHEVTAEQTGALPITGGTVDGDLTVTGSAELPIIGVTVGDDRAKYTSISDNRLFNSDGEAGLYLASENYTQDVIIKGVRTPSTASGDYVASKEYVDDAIYTKITTDATSGDKSITLTSSNSNNEWRYVYASGITSLALASSETFTNVAEAYYTVVFLSGTTATTITNTLGAYFSGDDCVDGVFTPAASKTYDLGIWWNGVKWQVAVRGSI